MITVPSGKIPFSTDRACFEEILQRYFPHFRNYVDCNRLPQMFNNPELMLKVFKTIVLDLSCDSLQKIINQWFSDYQDPCGNQLVEWLITNNTKTSEGSELIFCPYLLGAIAGDVIGSSYEAHNVANKNFLLFPAESRYTDDTILMVATIDACIQHIPFGTAYRKWAEEYIYAGFGSLFLKWVHSDNPLPYGSFGNGAAIRAIPISMYFNTREEIFAKAEESAKCTHNHPAGIQGAKAASYAVFLASRTSQKSEFLKKFSESFPDYLISRSISDIRKKRVFSNHCADTISASIVCFLESDSAIEAIINAIYIGGDSDTIAALTGAIATAFYRELPAEIIRNTLDRLPLPLTAFLAELIENNQMPIGRWAECCRKFKDDTDDVPNDLEGASGAFATLSQVVAVTRSFGRIGGKSYFHWIHFSVKWKSLRGKTLFRSRKPNRDFSSRNSCRFAPQHAEGSYIWCGKQSAALRCVFGTIRLGWGHRTSSLGHSHRETGKLWELSSCCSQIAWKTGASRARIAFVAKEWADEGITPKRAGSIHYTISAFLGLMIVPWASNVRKVQQKEKVMVH